MLQLKSRSVLLQSAIAAPVMAATFLVLLSSSADGRSSMDKREAAEIEAIRDALTKKASGDCDPTWIPTFGPVPGVLVGTGVQSFAVLDDGTGSGPALVVGGSFTSIHGMPASRIARWDGSQWWPLGDGIHGSGVVTVYALAVFDDGLGGGPALYAGGRFDAAGGTTVNHIARWDGKSWSSLDTGVATSPFGGDAQVRTLTVFDDGSGPALYAAGRFTHAGGVNVQHVARWDGTSWSDVGGGVGGVSLPLARALHVFDDGSGPALFLGGSFATAGGASAVGIARWDGVEWSEVGGGVTTSTGQPASVMALEMFDDGSSAGPALFAGGSFALAGGISANRIARWDGTNWSPLGSGLAPVNAAVEALTVHDDLSGSGPALYVGGTFTSAGDLPASRIARWDGSAWSALGAGASNAVRALLVHQENDQEPTLFVGGSFDVAGEVWANGIARWHSSSWTALADGLTGPVRAIASFGRCNSAAGALYVAGQFGGAGGTLVGNIVRWDGSTFESAGGGVSVGGVFALRFAESAPDDGAPALYVGGAFTQAGGAPANRVAKWDGSSWTPLGTGMAQNEVNALALFDDGDSDGASLYAGGSFLSGGGVSLSRIAKWNGTSWGPIGGGTNGVVWVLEVFDDGFGDGPALYAGGAFSSAGGVAAPRIARWNGEQWSAVGGGMNGTVRSLVVFDGALYAGGDFWTAGGVSANHIARWDGSEWHPLGTGTNGPVWAMAVYDDGTGEGPLLVIGGDFTLAGGVPVNGLARWDGSTWSAVPGDLGPCNTAICNTTVYALHVGDDGIGDGSTLFIGGNFISAPSGDSFLAKRGGCALAASVHFDLRHGSCPNPLNPKANGVLPAAILGDLEFDVSEIDVGSLSLSRADGSGGCISPLTGPPGPGVKIEDVGTPFTGPDPCDCHDLGGDGIIDLTLKFSIAELVAALELADLPAGTSVELRITGQLLDSTPFTGTDCITIVGQGNQPGESQPATGTDPGVSGDLTGNGHVGIGDLLTLLAAWGQCLDPDNCPADLDGDGTVGIADLLILLANWG